MSELEKKQTKKWKELSPGRKSITIKTSGFQTLGILVQQMFVSLNFKKKFKLVIEYDPENDDEKIFLKYSELMNEKENNTCEIQGIQECTKKVIRMTNEIRDDTANKKWVENSHGHKEIEIDTAAFQTLEILVGQMFDPLNFNKKFKIVIEHDPNDAYKNVYFKYYV
ncbi:hypothetical protein [Lachnotalea glycerini]|uniref:Uncharacterized protein n=1 Tax=Lachnotalea glycerini TaxID=1763509 RepID=A0A371JC61_9FIRM|nr:hypothetical protein [Lachnotalea glycerini]RDY30323.1 hypothetical protein CG710_015430 [Lachnotalea glycerini]